MLTPVACVFVILRRLQFGYFTLHMGLGGRSFAWAILGTVRVRTDTPVCICNRTRGAPHYSIFEYTFLSTVTRATIPETKRIHTHKLVAIGRVVSSHPLPCKTHLNGSKWLIQNESFKFDPFR